MKESKYKPLEDRVLLEEIKSAEIEKTEGGLYKPGEKLEKKGIVKRIGEGFTARDTGLFIETVLKEGDEVIYLPHSATPLELDLDGNGKKEYWLMREGDILLKV